MDINLKSQENTTECDKPVGAVALLRLYCITHLAGPQSTARFAVDCLTDNILFASYSHGQRHVGWLKIKISYGFASTVNHNQKEIMN